jgi:hypothetical protein
VDLAPNELLQQTAAAIGVFSSRIGDGPPLLIFAFGYEMAVGITLSKSVAPSRSAPQEPGVCFEDDGYYWFLYPFFERLAARTRQFIEPYGDAKFSGAQLVELEKAVAEARASAEVLPDSMEVKQVWFSPEPIVETIRREVLLNLLDQLGEVIRAGRQEGRAILCSGD